MVSKGMRVMLAIVTAFVVTGLLTIGAAGAQDTMKKGEDAAKKKVDEAKSADSKFVLEAAMGGMAEVQLGQLAVDKATSPDVKQFGQRMVDDHGKANQELTQLAGTKGITLPTTLDAKHQADVDRLSKLTGEEFDHSYMKMMVDDHNKDVADFQHESSGGKDPDVKAWAAKTLPTLEQHQSMAKSIAAKTMEPKKM